MAIEDLYMRFCNYINKNDLQQFKYDDNVTYMLEHVTFDIGIQYLNYIFKEPLLTVSDIIKYCELNDTIGGGIKYNYNFITTSPSNFRYIFHSHLILSHIKRLGLNNLNLVEVGCGYGGLCLALNYFSKVYGITINKYHLVDLGPINQLQKFYLQYHDIYFDLKFHDANYFGKDIDDNNLFLVSNYCFSEISKQNQEQYITHLIPKVSHGFMAWNHIPTYNFGFEYTEELEYPLTCSSHNPYLNKYVYF